ncbi:unnamed protein product [Arabidopsis lyrata]|nr:unnamed protein product [Arabidopsis lyrata]
MLVYMKLSIFLIVMLTFSQSYSDLVRFEDDNINELITMMIRVCKGYDDKPSCQNLLLKLKTVSSSLLEMRRRDLLIFVLKNSVWRVDMVMIGVRKDTKLLEEMEMESDMLVEELLGGGSPNLGSYENVHTWLSGVLTSYITCIDGIGEGVYKRRVNPELEELISRARVKKHSIPQLLLLIGKGFIGIYMCFRNTAGPAKGPAVALRVSGDMSVIHRCRIEGYQDVLYPHRDRQFYRECFITGTVDFICRFAAAVFQLCRIEARKPVRGQGNVITAQSRSILYQKSGFSIQKCNITASSDLYPLKATMKTFFGRPWKKFSTVAILQSFIDELVDPAGWTPWEGETGLSTLYYGEYQNNGPGAVTSKRVNWTGFRVISDPKEAAKFTIDELLHGESWLKDSGVPYEGGL